MQWPKTAFEIRDMLLTSTRPDVITSVTEHLRTASEPDSSSSSSSSSVHLPRVLLVLLYIIKELSTAKLQRSRVSLQKAAPEVLQVLAKVYVDRVNRWMRFIQHGGDDEGGAIDDIDHSLLALRVLRRLAIAGYDHPNRNSEVCDFWLIIQQLFGAILSLVIQHGQSMQPSIRGQIEKHLIQMSKLHLEMVRSHPSAFPLLPDSMSLTKAYWGLLLEFGKTFGAPSTAVGAEIGTDGDAEDEISYLEKISLKGLLLLRACVKMVYSPVQTFKYQPAEDKEETKQSTDSMRSNILSEPMVREMMETLVTRFFVFRLRDLRELRTDPDEWERRVEGQGDAWEFSIRICAEKLFLDLVINNKDLLIQPLLDVFYSVASM
jgi:hypothetical protein